VQGPGSIPLGSCRRGVRPLLGLDMGDSHATCILARSFCLVGRVSAAGIWGVLSACHTVAHPDTSTASVPDGLRGLVSCSLCVSRIVPHLSIARSRLCKS